MSMIKLALSKVRIFDAPIPFLASAGLKWLKDRQ